MKIIDRIKKHIASYGRKYDWANMGSGIPFFEKMRCLECHFIHGVNTEHYVAMELYKKRHAEIRKYMNYRRKQSGQDPVDVWKPDLMEILSLDIGSIDDTEVSEIDLKDILKESAGDLQASLEVEKKSRNELDDGKPRDPENKITMETQSVDTNTIGGRMAAFSYSEEQMKEALKGLGNGLTEEQVLMYFLPEFSATKMASMRKLYEKVNHA